MKSRKPLLAAAHYRFFTLLTGILAIIVIQILYQIAQQRQMAALKEEMIGQFNKQTELISESRQYIGEKIAEGTAATGNQIARINANINRTERIYAGILETLNKRTLDSLYTENVLVDKEREADALFSEGKYAMASAHYVVVAEAQPDNRDARFYYLYSLFLGNKMDRGNYRRIKDGLQTLERNGYQRKEIKEVLAFIELEENGLEAEVTQ